MTVAPAPAPDVVEAIFLVEDGAYLLTPSWGQNLVVDGIPVKPGTRVVVSNPESVLLERRHPPQLAHYVNKDTGATTTRERFQNDRAEIVRDREDENGDIDFESLEQEYNYKKFLATWEPVYSEPTVEHRQVTLKVTEVRRESGDPHIESLWNAPSALDQNRCLFKLNRQAAELHAFRERAEQHGLAAEVPSHSGLEFAKAGGEYIFHRDYVDPKTPFIGSLEACKEEKRKRVAVVLAAVDRAAAKRSPRPVEGVGALVSALDTISRQLRSVIPKAGERASLNKARNDLDALVARLVEKAL